MSQPLSSSNSPAPSHHTGTPRLSPQTAAWHFSYPFALRNKKAPNDMRSHFEALSAMSVGYFPLASTGFLNGSLHFGEECTALAIDKGFRCLADGEVVAYKLDSTLLAMDYDRDRKLRYSLGFVLVRHRLGLPPVAPSADAQSGGPASSATSTSADVADDGIAIFSLYSYNRPLADYPKDRDDFFKETLPFWQGGRRYRVGSRANDVQMSQADAAAAAGHPTRAITWSGEAPEDVETTTEPSPTGATGLRVRAHGNGKAEIIGLLPRGCIFTVRATATHGWAQIAAFERGGALPYVVDGDVSREAIANGWVFLDELDSTLAPKPLNEVVVLDEPHPVKAGDLLGYLGENSGKDLAQPRGGVQTPRPRVAIEVFAGDELPGYLERARQRAAALPDEEKTVLVIERGAKLCKEPRFSDIDMPAGHYVAPCEGISTSGHFVCGQLFGTERTPVNVALRAGQTVGGYTNASGSKQISPAAYAKLKGTEKDDYTHRELLTPIGKPGDYWGLRTQNRAYIAPLWTTPPLVPEGAYAATAFEISLSRRDLDALGEERRFIDRDGSRWWRVDVGGTNNEPLFAWVCDKNMPGTRWESPHAWPGFHIADGSLFEPMEAMQRTVCIEGDVHPEHEESFWPVADALGKSDMVIKLEHAIDHTRELAGRVTAATIAHARRTHWLAHGLSRLIVRFPSQWSHDIERWKKLTPLMREEWKTEMVRQEKRGWWKEVAGKVEGFPDDPCVHHIHPLGWVDNLTESTHGRVSSVVSELASIIAMGESGSYDSYNTGTQHVKDGEVGHSFTKLGPVRVTKQTINQILATKPLPGTDVRRLFATGRYQTVFDTLREARDHMNLSGDELYDADMQERVLREHLIPTAGGGALQKFLTRGIGSVDEAQLAAAKQWASFGVPAGMANSYGRISDGFTSYYDKDGVNKSHKHATTRLREYLVDIDRSHHESN